jgi:hypothetical protein
MEPTAPVGVVSRKAAAIGIALVGVAGLAVGAWGLAARHAAPTAVERAAVAVPSPAPNVAAPSAPPAAPPAPAPTVAPAAAPVPAAPATVTIRLVVRPEGARVLVDGTPLAGTTLTIPRGAPSPRLRVEADGYQPLSVLAPTDADREMPLTLAPRARPAKPHRAKKDDLEDPYK